MAAPTTYNRFTNFKNAQALAPTAPLNGASVDEEYNRIKIAVDSIIAALEDVRRDDGTLKNGVVTRDSLSAGVLTGFGAPRKWESGISFATNDTTFYDGIFYIANSAHVSTVSNRPDVDTTTWTLIADFTSAGFVLTPDSVDDTHLVNMPEATIKGRALAAGTGNPQNLTATQVRAILFAATGVSGSEIADGAIVTAKAADGAMTNAKLADMAEATFKMRAAGAGTGAPIDGTATQARAALGATATGTALLMAADQAAARTAIGATAVGAAVLTAANEAAARAAIAVPVDRGHIFGLTLSNNTTDATNDIDIAAGEAASDDTTPARLTLASALTKRLDAAWAVGTGNGGLDTGSIADTTYHVWLIRRSDTGVVDALFSTSATSPTMPSGYDQKRRIGSIIRASGAIIAFVQTGDTFQHKTPVLDVNVTNPGTSAVLRTLTVPLGVKVEALIDAAFNNDAGVSNGRTWVSDPDTNDVDPTVAQSYGYGVPNSNSINVNIQVRCFTNTSGQVRTRAAQSTAGSGLAMLTRGWVDTRGRLF